MPANPYAADAKDTDSRAQVDPDLLDASGGPVLMAFMSAQADERITAPHRHARGQLFGATRGLMTVGTRGGQWVVPAIHAVWVPPHELHSIRSHGAFEGWSVYVAEDACEHLPSAPRTVRVSPLLSAAVERAAGWPQHAALDEDQHSLARVILAEIRGLPTEDFGLPAPQDARLLKIARELAAHPDDDRDLHAWARFAGLSERSISRRFVAETGYTFNAWRQRARLLRALELLAARHSVTEVALSLGYETVSGFIALFKRSFGATPARFLQSRR